MSTTTGPSLEPARRAVEKLMDDVLKVTRNPSGEDDSTLDDEGHLVEKAPVDVYEGKGMVTVASSNVALPQKAEEGGGYYVQMSYSAAIPIGADAELLEGDLVVVLSSRRDPSLLTKVFYVHKIVGSTMAVSRKFQLEERQ